MSEATGPDAFETAEEPFALFGLWLGEAEASEPNDPNGMAVATVDDAGLPDCRMVLLKGWDERGFVFYTNVQSAKGRQLAGDPQAALLFHWKSLRRQVRVRGHVEPTSEAEADAYFASRARQSRLGALASDQSRPLESRAVLVARAEALAARYADEEPPRPPHWSGFRVRPLQVEFWKDGAYRLHDRRVFTRGELDGSWTVQRLYP